MLGVVMPYCIRVHIFSVKHAVKAKAYTLYMTCLAPLELFTKTIHVPLCSMEKLYLTLSDQTFDFTAGIKATRSSCYSIQAGPSSESFTGQSNKTTNSREEQGQ